MKHLSKAFRIGSVALACIQNMTLGGILYGWASISGTMLLSDGADGGPGLTRDYVHIMFVFASFANMLAPLVLGIVLDTFGPRTCSTISIIFILIGSALFSFSDTEHFNLFIPAMCMISFGGPGTQTAIIHLSNLFPQWKATTTAIITGSFQLSFFVFFIFDQLWLFLKIDFRSLFMGYCVVCIINAIISLTLWPDTPYTFDELLHDPPEGEEEVDESEVFMLSILFSFIHFITILLTLHKLHLGIIRLPSQFFHHSPKIGSPRVEERLFLERRSPTRELKVEELTNIKDFTLLQQLLSAEYVRLTIFFLVCSFWANFYIGTFDMQIGDSMQYTFVDQRNFARFFTIVSAAGVVVIPFIGTMMDRVGFPTTAFVTVSCAVLWAALLLVKTHTALFVSFIFYSLFRTFFFTFLFAYLADVLGFKYFGVLAGVMFVLGGFLGLLQYPLAQWAAGTCHTSDDNPFISGCSHGKWESLNFVMLLSLLGTYYFCYTDYKNRKKYIMDSSRTNRANSGKSLEIFPVNNDYDESTTNLIGTKFSTFGNQNKSVYGSV